MSPSRSDVEQLVAALFTVVGGVSRARKKIPDAAMLAVLQVVGAAMDRPPEQRIRPSEIAQILEVHRSAVTHQLQALQKAGQITLTVDPADRRSSMVELTDQGKAEVENLTATGLDRFASFVADWTSEEVQDLTRLLIKFEESKAAAVARTPPPSAPNWRAR
jgi:DNA-binding MarR family transcriptional regulator